jgi:Skp family chaperone for outer membrane proteins
MEAMDHATLAGLVAAAIAALRAFERWADNFKARSNGGTVYDNVKRMQDQADRIEDEVKDLRDKMQRTHRDLCEFREQFNTYTAYRRGLDDARKEGANG